MNMNSHNTPISGDGSVHRLCEEADLASYTPGE